MNIDYSQLPPTPGYDFNQDIKFDYCLLFPDDGEREYPVTLGDLKKDAVNYIDAYSDEQIKDNTQEDKDKIASYREKYGLAAGAAIERDNSLEHAQQNKRNGILSGINMATSYDINVALIAYNYLSKSSFDISNVGLQVLGTCGLLYAGLDHKGSQNFAFQVSRKFMDNAQQDIQHAKYFDKQVFMTNGGDISQCTFKQETLDWANNFKIATTAENKM